MLPDDEVELLDRYWRAANYLTVGQIYLLDNPLLREPLEPEHVKPRLLGHWGTSPGLNLLYTHLNRVIRATDSDMIFLAGPGHGGPAVVANVWLEGTYSEIYPNVGPDDGRAAAPVPAVLDARRHPEPRQRADARARSTRAASSATCSCHAFGAAFDNPDLIVVARRRRRRGRDRPARRLAGRASGSSTRPATARCCRSSTSTGTRSPGRPSSAAPATTTSARSSPATATTSASSRVTTRPRSTRTSPRRSTTASARSARSRTTRATARRRGTVRAGRPSCCARRRAGPAQGGRRQPGRGDLPRPPGAGRQRRGERRAPPRCSRRGCAATGPRSCSTRHGRLVPRAGGAGARRATAAWAPTRTPTGARCLVAARPARLRRLRASRSTQPGDRAAGVDPPARHDAARHLHAATPTGELPPLLPGRDQLEPPRRRVRGREPVPRRPDRSTSTTTSPPRAA